LTEAERWSTGKLFQVKKEVSTGIPRDISSYKERVRKDGNGRADTYILRDNQGI
jgi:hypothetical protein